MKKNKLNLGFCLPGIQYGAAKRFELPTPAPSWSGVYNATAYREACPQMGIGKPPPGVPPFQTATISENCLYANVWAPVDAAGAKNRSVMVFIHGGGFTGKAIKCVIQNLRNCNQFTIWQLAPFSTFSSTVGTWRQKVTL